MRTMGCRLDLGSLERPVDDRGYRGGDGHALPRRAGAQEHASAGRCGPTTTQIRGDRFSHIVRQWQRALLTSFATDVDGRVVPINIIQLEEHDLSRSQPQSRQNQQNGAIAKPAGSASRPALCENSTNGLERQCSRNRCHRPMGHCRNGSDKGSINVAPIMHETQKRANHGHQQARRFGRSKLAYFVQGEIADLLGGQSLQIRSASRAGSREESMRDGGVNHTARRSKSALVEQICRVLIDQRIHLGLLTSQKRLRRYESSTVHPHQEMLQCGRISASAGLTISQKYLANGEREFRHPNALLVKPSTESNYEPGLAQESLVRVSLLVERSRIRLQDRTQRTFDRSERYLALPATHRTNRPKSASPIFEGRLCRTLHAVNACKSLRFRAMYEVLPSSPRCGIVLGSRTALPTGKHLRTCRPCAAALNAGAVGGRLRREATAARRNDASDALDSTGASRG